MAGQKAVIMDADGVRRALTRIAFEIIEKNKGAEDMLLAGVKTRGVFLAQRIAAKLGEVEGKAPPVLELDVTPWRDDKPRADGPLPPPDPRSGGDRGAGGRRAVHWPHRARRDRGRVALRARGPHPARRAGGPRPPRASHPAGLYRQKPAHRAGRARMRPPDRGGRGGQRCDLGQ